MNLSVQNLFYIMLSESSQDSATIGEEELIQAIRPELNHICSNKIRACILHILSKSKNLNYSLNVEEIAKAIGKQHSVVIHHLEKLSQCNLVKVVKTKTCGGKEKRAIWGLDIRYPNLISIAYNHTLKRFFTQAELDKMCGVNKDVRNVKNIP